MRKLKYLWECWKVAARKLADLQARLLLTLFYYLVLSPFALVFVFFLDPLRIKRRYPLTWLSMPRQEEDEQVRARRQF